MAMYLIGDVQGCDGPLQRLLETLAFSPSRDQIVLLGDLVNRGPGSAAVLRRVVAMGASARCVLGNHDLHLLAVAQGVREPGRRDTLTGLLQAPDCDALVAWLREQPLALWERNCLMVHAGVLPDWTVAQTLSLAREVQAVLQGPDLRGFLKQMYGNSPDHWHDDLRGKKRLRVIVNALTRLRFCTADGVMDFEAKEGADSAPAGYMPWFDVPGRRTADVTVAFGHWSTLGWLDRPDVLALDSGCVWGGCLSALRLGERSAERELIQVKCPQAQSPG